MISRDFFLNLSYEILHTWSRNVEEIFLATLCRTQVDLIYLYVDSIGSGLYDDSVGKRVNIQRVECKSI